MTDKPTRRVRAGRPVDDNTGCLPVQYTEDQIEAWRADELDFITVVAVSVILVLSIGAAIYLAFGGAA